MAVLKLIFVLVIVLTICYQTNVNCFDDNYTLFVWQNFANVERRQLYQFVTNPELVDRWMKWLPFFMAADFKPLGVNKHFLIFSNEFQYLLRVTDHELGKFLALECELFLRPRIELRFSELPLNQTNTESPESKLEIRMIFQRTSILFQNTIGRIYRMILQTKLKESLEKLHAILTHMPKSTCCINYNAIILNDLQ